jgi:hypothetical protein
MIARDQSFRWDDKKIKTPVIEFMGVFVFVIARNKVTRQSIQCQSFTQRAQKRRDGREGQSLWDGSNTDKSIQWITAFAVMTETKNFAPSCLRGSKRVMKKTLAILVYKG